MSKWIKAIICWFSHSMGLAFMSVIIVQSVRGCEIDLIGALLCVALCAVVQIWVDPRPSSWFEKEEDDDA